MQHGEAVVRGVGQDAGRQDAPVPAADPGYLQKGGNKNGMDYYLLFCIFSATFNFLA